jgi:diguanylate cyclase (GGDEF)-like protein
MRVGSFRTHITLAFLALLTLVLGIVLVAVQAAHTRNARGQIQQNLLVAGRVFHRLLETRDRQLGEAVRLLAEEFAFRAAVATHDRPTILSAMQNHQRRIKADVMMLVSLDGRLEATTLHPGARVQPFPFPELVKTAEQRGEASAFLALEGRLFQVVMVPVRAPLPVAWMLMGFAIDDGVATDFQSLTGAYVSFARRGEGAPTVMASTLPERLRHALPEALAPTANWEASTPISIELAGHEYVTLLVPVGRSIRTVAVLHHSLDEALAPLGRLQFTLFGVFASALAISVVAGVLLARSLSRPLTVLAEGAQRIERGDYSHRVALGQGDEMGQLASAFNSMAKGIADREEQLRHQAYHDALTGLPNRTFFHHLVHQAIRAAERDGQRLGILLLDLDRFKEINDTLGHNVGDLLLAQLGPRLRDAIRESDTVARLGGDEFAVLLRTVADPQDAIVVAQRIVKALERPFHVESQPLDVDASVGIALYPEHGDSGVTLLRRADVAMYEAKRSASGHALYSAAMDRGSPRRLALIGELRQAIEENQLVLHYQPKVDLATDRIADVEALLRWQHPKLGMMWPNEFIPLAEQTGLMRPLTLWVLRTALDHWRRWRESGITLGVAVNLSARLLLDRQFPDEVAACLRERAVPPSTLVLEVTESAIMADPACAKEIMRRLDALGVRLAVDDFGTGYSSLAYLRELPVDELKIDKSFVADLPTDRNNAVIVRSTIELAHNLGLRVTAEGVTTWETCAMLKRLGCDLAQGYLFSRAKAPADLVAWLEASPWAGRPGDLAPPATGLLERSA